MTDSEFRNMLKTNPNSVYAGRDVTPEEIQALGAMDWDAVGSVARDLDARISRMGAAMAGCK